MQESGALKFFLRYTPNYLRGLFFPKHRMSHLVFHPKLLPGSTVGQ